MLKRKSNFTLIELIVVIVVLGILAAIVIPNISSFSDEARDVQLTADARNIQTAVDMYRAKSPSGTADPVVDVVTITATKKYEVNETTGEYEVVDLADAEKYHDADKDNVNDSQLLKLVDTDALKDKYLRKLPKYVKNGDFLSDTDEITVSEAAAKVEFEKGEVLAGILQGADGKSTAIVKFVAPMDTNDDGTIDDNDDFVIVR